MKYFLSGILSICIGCIAVGQNQISTPSGQSLKVSTDTLVGNNFKISNTLSLAGYRFLGIKKTAAGELNGFVGPNSGNLTMTGRWNSFFGENAGMANSSGSFNTFFGAFSGSGNTTATSNTFVGFKSGLLATSGKYNTMAGNTSGAFNTTGESNIFLGLDAGYSNTTGFYNVYLGRAAGVYNTSGGSNTALGYGAGYNNTTGSGNVYLGAYAGFNASGNNKLYIANSATNLPLVYGEFPASATTGGKFVINGQLGIGVSTFPTTAGSTNTSAFQLFVNGGMLSKELTVSNTWADYVFDRNYRLRPLDEVEKFIKRKNHLPNVPTAAEISQQGLNLGDIARIQQEKIEELTLYLIRQNKMLDKQEAVIKSQMSQIEVMAGVLENTANCKK